jgi:hypothetical protein
MPTKKTRLSDYLVDIACSPYKQSVSLLITGEKGKGKSYAGLSIANACSERLAERIGGIPADYFNTEIDMAIISGEEVDRVSTLQRKYGIKIYDDVSIGWSARDWRSSGNSAKNDIFTIDRIAQGISIFTLPQGFMLDKIPRSLTGFYCEMDQKYFSRGFSTMKFFKTVFLGRDNELTYRHITSGDTKYVLYVIPKPPQDLCDWYDKRREKITYQEIEKRRAQPELPGPGKTPAQSKKLLNMQSRIAVYKDKIAGLPLPEKVKVLRSLGVPRETAYYWKNQGYLNE